MAELAGIGGNEGMPVGGGDVGRPEQDESAHDEQLDGNHDIVEPGRFLGAADQHRGQREDNQGRGNVDDSPNNGPIRQLDLRPGGGGGLGRVGVPQSAYERRYADRTADRHGRGDHGVLENEVPADDPGKNL